MLVLPQTLRSPLKELLLLDSRPIFFSGNVKAETTIPNSNWKWDSAVCCCWRSYSCWHCNGCSIGIGKRRHSVSVDTEKVRNRKSDNARRCGIISACSRKFDNSIRSTREEQNSSGRRWCKVCHCWLEAKQRVDWYYRDLAKETESSGQGKCQKANGYIWGSGKGLHIIERAARTTKCAAFYKSGHSWKELYHNLSGEVLPVAETFISTPI